jgi:hypothetical protein
MEEALIELPSICRPAYINLNSDRTADEAGVIQSLSQAILPGLSAWVEVVGIASSLCLKAPPPQPIST